MSDEGEKTCPLCAEEMDLTDQQLKPCKCGYEICVWCWHHIMDMAEKDDTEGRCPACRSPYNKDKIVGTAASCERLVAEMSMEKKVRSQKGKSKTTEGRKQLSSVRVIQRNLVYIVGLPLNLADEDLLQRIEYFAQYGKVLKVSISRTAAGAIQQFTNSTCSVYITYSKEDEAVRCIQSVHGYVLEGRPLRACFGTTKYCHAWLRNVPCSNPDCLYLHEVGSQEDSFTKDEIISAYTRSRVQQITGVTNCTQRRSGNVLPPPADDYCNNSSASSDKPITKNATSNSTSSIRISPPNSSSGRSVALPAGASWGTRPSSNQPASGSFPSSDGPLKHKPVTGNGPVTFSTALASSNQSPISHSDVLKKVGLNDDGHSTQEESKLTSETEKIHVGAVDRLVSASDASVTSAYHTTTTSSNPHSPPATRDKAKLGSLHPNTATSVHVSLESGKVGSVKVTEDDGEKKHKNSRSEMSSGGLDGHQGLEHVCMDKITEPYTSQSAGTAVVVPQHELCVSRSKSDLALESAAPQTQVASVDDKDDVLSFEDQRLKDPEVFTNSSFLTKFSHSRHPPSIVRGVSPQINSSFGVHDNFQIVDNKVDSISQSTSTPVFYRGYPENQLNNFSSLSNNNIEHPCIYSHDERPNNRRLESELASLGQNGAADNGESSIISNILSLDLDSWDESLASPKNLAKLLGETDKQQRSHGVSGPRKVQQSNQSRFSFAREEEPMNQALGEESSLNYMEQAFRPNSYGQEFANKTSYNLDKFGTRNGFSFVNAEEPDPYSGFSSSRIPVSRSQVSAPPGFLTPNRAPPPGFTYHERLAQASMNSFSGHNMFEASSVLRNQYQAPQPGNLVSNGDIEFMDPAILAVGKGRLPDGLNSSGLDMRSKFSPQVNTFENDARHQLLMQRSLSSHQNPRYDMGDPYSSLSDSFRIPSRVMEQSLTNNLSPFSQVGLPQSRNSLLSNGHWDSWNEVQGGNNMGMSELLRSERLGYNKFYNGYEDSKLHMSSQGDLYNRTFGL